MKNQQKVDIINRNNSQGSEGVVELQKTQKERRFKRHNSSETVTGEKKWKIRAFPATRAAWSGWRDSSVADDTAGGGIWPNSISHATTPPRLSS